MKRSIKEVDFDIYIIRVLGGCLIKRDTNYFPFLQAVSILLIMAEFVRHEYRVRIN